MAGGQAVVALDLALAAGELWDGGDCRRTRPDIAARMWTLAYG